MFIYAIIIYFRSDEECIFVHVTCMISPFASTTPTTCTHFNSTASDCFRIQQQEQRQQQQQKNDIYICRFIGMHAVHAVVKIRV